MNLDCYTQYIPLTSKARFWGNFVSALKGLTALKLWLHHWPHSNSGSNDLYASPVPHVRTYYPSIVEALPRGEMKLKHEFGKLEDLMWRNRRGTSLPPTPVLPEANDRFVKQPGSQAGWVTETFVLFRIHTVGYNYCPVHTEIYGSYRNRDRRTYY